jgi:uncharacterized Zn finger protein
MIGEFNPDVVRKAEKLLTEDGVTADTDHPHAIWWVTGSNGDNYRVQADYDPTRRTLSWITCTCPHGLNAGGGAARCYHVAAVLLLLRDEQP